MLRSIQSSISVFLVLTASLSAQAVEPEPATILFHDQGFTVEAPAGASLLEVRLMDPARTLLLDRRTARGPIAWTLSGSEADGEYRYEAVVVMNIDGKARQRTLPGGFEVKGGLVIAPPRPATGVPIQDRLDHLSTGTD